MLGLQVVVVHSSAQDPFDIHGTRDALPDMDAAAWADGRYIPTNQFYDGCAEIDSKVVTLGENAEERTRPLLSISSRWLPLRSPLYVRENDPERHEVFHRLCASGEIMAEALRPLTRLYRPWWMAMYD